MATTSDILTASAGNWTLIPDRSTVTFRNMTLWGLATVTGKFSEFTGVGSAGAGVNGRVVSAAASVRSGIGKRDDHLRSGDFVDVEA
ncbi:YceI family protein, partial [Streptomyces edwardsiae]